MAVRKIVHIDMDAFYASVEQRDHPPLHGHPLIVAWQGPRSVVCSASYEARRLGVRSALPALRAQRLCPEAIFVPPDFPRYRAVSQQVREIFQRHTDLVEPLSLDEAYLDVNRHPGRPHHPRTDPGRTAADGLGWRRAEQVSGQDCFGLAQTRWPVRHPAE
jgi:DNA polymerase-4